MDARTSPRQRPGAAPILGRHEPHGDRPRHAAPGQRAVLVRQRAQVQALPQAARGPCAAGRGQPDARPVPATSTGRPTPTPATSCPWDEPRVKSPEIIERMRHAGAVAAEVLRLAGEMVAPGVTTDEHRHLRARPVHRAQRLPAARSTTTATRRACAPRSTKSSATASPTRGSCRTATSSTSTSPRYIGGVHGDTNATFFVGDVDPESRQLVQVTEECMWHGIEAVMPGRPLSDIGRAIEDHAKKYRYGVVRAFIGHGIGEQFHGDIQVLHYYDARASHDHAPGHDVHDRADDHPRHVAAQDAGTTTGPRSPPTASAPPSSSTPSSSPTTASTCSRVGRVRRARRLPGTADSGRDEQPPQRQSGERDAAHQRHRGRASRSSQCGASVGMIAADSPSRRRNPQIASSTPTSSWAASAANVRPRRPITIPTSAETTATSGNTNQIGRGPVTAGSDKYCQAPTTSADSTGRCGRRHRAARHGGAGATTTPPAPPPRSRRAGPGSTTAQAATC